MPETVLPPKPALSVKAKAGYAAVLAIAFMLARYVGVEVPECPPSPVAPPSATP